MIPNRDAGRLALRLAGIGRGKNLDAAESSQVSELQWPILLASAERLQKEADGTNEALADGIVLRLECLPAAERPAWIEPVLRFCLAPRAALRAHRSQLPGELLARLIEKAALLQIQDALIDRMRAVEVLAFPAEIAAQVARFRSPPASASHGIAGEMRMSQQLEDLFRILTGGRASEENVVETLRAAEGIELSARHLRVVVAAVFPVLRAPSGEQKAALQAAAAWQKWLAEIPRLRAGWLQSEDRAENRPMLPEGSHEVFEARHMLRLSGLLTSVVEADSRGDKPPVLPEAVYVEKALDEAGSLLLDFCLASWRENEELTHRVLSLLPALHISRAKLWPLAERLLAAAPAPPERIQLAGLALLERLLAGLSALDASIASPQVVFRSGDERYAALDQESRAILEASERIRHQLTLQLVEPSRSAAFREQCVYVLLGAQLPPQEEERLFLQAVRGGDAALLAGFLRFVGDHAVQRAHPRLVELHPRVTGFSERLRELFSNALAAAAHEEIPRLLRQEVLEGKAEAETTIRRMGAYLALDQVVSERQIRATLKEIEILDRARAAALSAETSSFAGAMSATGVAQAAAIEASRGSMAGHARAAELTVQNAELQLELLPRLDQLQALLGQVRHHQDRLKVLRQNVERLRTAIQGIRAQIENGIRDIRAAEAEVDRKQNEIGQLDRRQQELRDRISRLTSELDRRRSDLSSLERQLSRVGHGEEQEAQRRDLGRQVQSASAKVGEISRDVSRAESELGSIPGQLASLQRAIDALQSDIHRLESHVQDARSHLAARNSEQVRIHGQAAQTESELNDLRRRAGALRVQIREIGERGEAEAARRRAELERIQQDVDSQMRHLAEARQAAATALGEARDQRNRATRASSDILAADQDNANLQEAITAKKPDAAAELASLSARAKKAEIAEQQRRRLIQELEISIDVLMAYLRIMMGPTMEVKRLFDKLEGRT